MTATKAELLALVKDLRDYDYCFLMPDGAKHFSEPFGFTAKTYVAQDDRHNPKGLRLPDGMTEAEGIDAADLATQICDHLKVPYNGALIGRGFRLRNRCDALQAHVEKMP